LKKLKRDHWKNLLKKKHEEEQRLIKQVQNEVRKETMRISDHLDKESQERMFQDLLQQRMKVEEERIRNEIELKVRLEEETRKKTMGRIKT